MTPTREILYGLFRTILMVASTSLVARGVVTQGTIEEVAGALSIVALAAYSAWAKIKLAKKVEAKVLGNTPAEPPGPTGTTIVSLFVAGLLAFGCLTGCHKSTLQPGGAYAPVGQQADMAFYAVDGAFDLAYSAIDAAFKFERDNRTALWKVSPQIKHTLDSIRPEAARVRLKYLTARATYKSLPTPAGLTDLQLALTKIQQLSASALAVIPKGN